MVEDGRAFLLSQCASSALFAASSHFYRLRLRLGLSWAPSVTILGGSWGLSWRPLGPIWASLVALWLDCTLCSAELQTMSM